MLLYQQNRICYTILAIVFLSLDSFLIGDYAWEAPPGSLRSHWHRVFITGLSQCPGECGPRQGVYSGWTGRWAYTEGEIWKENTVFGWFMVIRQADWCLLSGWISGWAICHIYHKYNDDMKFTCLVFLKRILPQQFVNMQKCFKECNVFEFIPFVNMEMKLKSPSLKEARFMFAWVSGGMALT